MYILKIQGTNKIADFVQIRDDSFTLIAYFKISHPKRALDKCGLAEHIETILNVAKSLPYGQIRRLDL
jgi:hypothetical protein